VKRGIIPTVNILNMLLDIYSHSKDPIMPAKGERLLNLLKGTTDGRRGLQPDVVSYNSVISAWGRSKASDAEERAFHVFASMMESGLKPDVVSYSALLTAISTAKDDAAGARADRVFDEMLQHGVKPDIKAWTIYLTIWTKSRSRTREGKSMAS
jgi:pentatricopeptide repeat protein